MQELYNNSMMQFIKLVLLVDVLIMYKLFVCKLLLSYRMNLFNHVYTQIEFILTCSLTTILVCNVELLEGNEFNLWGMSFTLCKNIFYTCLIILVLMNNVTIMKEVNELRSIQHYLQNNAEYN